MLRPKEAQFQFVNIENPEQSGQVETRKLVRRHVIQQHRQKRLYEQRRDTQFSNDISFEEVVIKSKETSKLLCIEECATCGRSVLRTVGSNTQAVATRPQFPANETVRLGSGRADPFGTYAAEMNSYMYELLDHPPVVLGRGIEHFDICQGHKRLTYCTTLYCGEAIRLVNEMLQDKDRAISDEMVACMVKLSTFESFSGDHRGWRAHADALVEIVRRRRGLQSLGYVKGQCNETDVMGAMVGGTRPRFCPVPETDLVPLLVFLID
ncbi:hypothetical protein MMC18_007278 [Xylographa bjoerkii]|nr:hypothetical protein [Xylographa bjoerkii]